MTNHEPEPGKPGQPADAIAKWCYWSCAASALAQRQTIEDETRAKLMLTRLGHYLNPVSGERFPFPAPEPSADMLAKFPSMKDKPRDDNARMKLLMHRQATYRRILEQLRHDGEIKFYDPVTLLRLSYSNEVSDPIVFLDEVAEQIVQYSKEQAAPEVEGAKLPVDRVALMRRYRELKDDKARTRTLANEFGISDRRVRQIVLKEMSHAQPRKSNSVDILTAGMKKPPSVRTK